VSQFAAKGKTDSGIEILREARKFLQRKFGVTEFAACLLKKRQTRERSSRELIAHSILHLPKGSVSPTRSER
jgi:hypothetical protein